jgi:hypothetical protein
MTFQWSLWMSNAHIYIGPVRVLWSYSGYMYRKDKADSRPSIKIYTRARARGHIGRKGP